jgi:hypothetical protein
MKQKNRVIRPSKSANKYPDLLAAVDRRVSILATRFRERERQNISIFDEHEKFDGIFATTDPDSRKE